jgi:hypothetical protein
LLIDYFLRESLGAHQHRQAIQSAAGTMCGPAAA